MHSTPKRFKLASHSFSTAVRVATLFGDCASTPSPNFVKIIGRLEGGSAFSAVLTTSSEWPDP
jgi:hypothetical protein